MAAFLLTRGASADAKDGQKSTPLHAAGDARVDSAELADHLVRHGSKVNARNRDGLTPLHLAAKVKRTLPVLLIIG